MQPFVHLSIVFGIYMVLQYRSVYIYIYIYIYIHIYIYIYIVIYAFDDSTDCQNL